MHIINYKEITDRFVWKTIIINVQCTQYFIILVVPREYDFVSLY